jgi:hypothetical protein
MTDVLAPVACHGLLDGVEDGHAPLEGLPALPRGDAGDHLRAVLDHLLRVERAVAARDPLDDHLRAWSMKMLTGLPPFASSTAFFTASSMSVRR